jgi:hypothetical protein
LLIASPRPPGQGVKRVQGSEAIEAALVRLTPLHQLSQRSERARLAIIAGSGLLCWGLTFELLMWLLALIIYRVGEFYFDTTLGTVPGITRTNVGQFGFATANELWLRQFVPA